jgi:CRP-like cAMP-binding protein
MALEEDIAVLAGAPLLSLMERDALRLLAFAAEQRSLQPGEVLFSKGDRSDGAYVVTRGTVLLDPAGDGSPAPFVAEPGTLIGQTALFVRSGRRATATARELSAVVRISPTLMRRVLEEFPRAAVTIQGALARDLAALSDQLAVIGRRLEAIDAAAPPSQLELNRDRHVV